MRFFPKIYFVDSLPLGIIERKKRESKSLAVVLGFYRPDGNIFILRGYSQKTLLLHELTHWAIHKIFGWNSMLHGLLDRHSRFNQKGGWQEKKQIKERKDYWKRMEAKKWKPKKKRSYNS